MATSARQRSNHKAPAEKSQKDPRARSPAERAKGTSIDNVWTLLGRVSPAKRTEPAESDSARSSSTRTLRRKKTIRYRSPPRSSSPQTEGGEPYRSKSRRSPAHRGDGAALRQRPRKRGSAAEVPRGSAGAPKPQDAATATGQWRPRPQAKKQLTLQPRKKAKAGPSGAPMQENDVVVKQEPGEETEPRLKPRPPSSHPPAWRWTGTTGRGDGGEWPDAPGDSREPARRPAAHRPVEKNLGKGGVSALYCRVDEGAELEDVADDLRKLGAIILLVCCATPQIAESIQPFLQREADEAEATTRGGGVPRYAQRSPHQYQCQRFGCLLVGGRDGIVSNVLRIDSAHLLDPEMAILIAMIQLNVTVCNMESLTVACCRMNFNVSWEDRDAVKSLHTSWHDIKVMLLQHHVRVLGGEVPAMGEFLNRLRLWHNPRIRGCGANIVAWQPYLWPADQLAVSSSCMVLLGPITKINLAHGDPEKWSQPDGDRNLVMLTSESRDRVPDPILPRLAGYYRGSDKKRQWHEVDMRSHPHFKTYPDYSFWEPQLSGMAGNDSPAVAGGLETAGWLPFAKSQQKTTEHTLEHGVKLLIYLEGTDSRRAPDAIVRRNERRRNRNPGWNSWHHV